MQIRLFYSFKFKVTNTNLNEQCKVSLLPLVMCWCPYWCVNTPSGVLLVPTLGPAVVDVLCDVSGWVAGGEEELLRLAWHQDQSQVDLQQTMCHVSPCYTILRVNVTQGLSMSIYCELQHSEIMQLSAKCTQCDYLPQCWPSRIRN